MVKNKTKKDWTRRGPKCKFITASVTPRELEQTHIVAAAMNMTISGCLRQLISDQHAILLSGGKYISPVSDKLDLSEE